MEKAKLLTLRITERCNLACRYCYAARANQSDMPFGIAALAIDRFAGAGGKLKIQFTGGEPLLCLDLMEQAAAYARQQGIAASFSVQTNGTLLSEAACRALKAMNCAVGVSLDGMAGANALRVYPDGRPAFQDAVAGVKRLGAQGVRCNLNAVVTRVNQHKLHELIDLAAYLGNVRGVGLDMFRPLGRGKGGAFAPDASLKADVARMAARASELKALGADVRIKEIEKLRYMAQRGITGGCYCYAGTGESFAVDYNGDVYPCSSFAGLAEYRMGNIAGELCAPQPSVCLPDAACVGCRYLPLCRGGCPAGRAACGGLNRGDCAMHQAFIDCERENHG